MVAALSFVGPHFQWCHLTHKSSQNREHFDELKLNEQKYESFHKSMYLFQVLLPSVQFHKQGLVDL